MTLNKFRSNSIEELTRYVKGCCIVATDQENETIWVHNGPFVHVAIMHDSCCSFNPTAAMAISQGNCDSALEVAYELLEARISEDLTQEEQEERFETEENEGYDPITDGFDGMVFTVKISDFLDLCKDLGYKYDVDFDRLTADCFDSFIDTALRITKCPEEMKKGCKDVKVLEDLYGSYSLYTEARKELEDQCEDFIRTNLKTFEMVYQLIGDWNMEIAGSDFAFTRNVNLENFSFSDGNWDFGQDFGEILTKSAKSYGPINLAQKIEVVKR